MQTPFFSCRRRWSSLGKEDQSFRAKNKEKKKGVAVSSINLSISINPIRSNRCREEIMTSALGTFYTKKKEKKKVEFPPTFRVRELFYILSV